MDRHRVQRYFKRQLQLIERARSPAVAGPVYSSLFSVYFIDGGGVSMQQHTRAHNLRICVTVHVYNTPRVLHFSALFITVYVIICS